MKLSKDRVSQSLQLSSLQRIEYLNLALNVVIPPMYEQERNITPISTVDEDLKAILG